MTFDDLKRYKIVDATTGETLDDGYIRKNAAEKRARKMHKRDNIAAIVRPAGVQEHVEA
jgi:hypothetical protein